MEKEFGTFRKSTFGGFNRKDVISYIEKMRNESYEYKMQVEETVKSLNEKILELENAARLMEVDLAVCGEEPPVSAENMSDIGDATKHLKAVADELCRSLGEFMDKLSRKGLFEKADDDLASEESFDLSVEEEPAAEESLVDGILSSLSFLYEGKAEAKPAVEEKNDKMENDTVADILGGLSFLN
jgi:hypothetical protein